MSQNQIQKTFSNRFFCKGKFVGAGNRRATPKGMVLEDFVISVSSELEWKQKRMLNITSTCYGDAVNKLKELRTGDLIFIEGVIDQSGKEGPILMTKKIEKEIVK